MSSKYNFSIFAALKDLSNYSLQELNNLAGDTYTVSSILDQNIKLHLLSIII